MFHTLKHYVANAENTMKVQALFFVALCFFSNSFYAFQIQRKEYSVFSAHLRFDSHSAFLVLHIAT